MRAASISTGAPPIAAGTLARVTKDSVHDQITITLPDGSTREYTSGSTPADVAASIGKRLAKATVAAKVDGEWVDVTVPINSDAKVELVTADSDDGREVLRHSTAHVSPRRSPSCSREPKYAIGPAIADGFYYDFELPDGAHFSEHDLERITKRMREIIKADQRFVHDEVDYDTGFDVFADQPYKREIIAKVRTGEADSDDAGEVGGDGGVSLYRNVGSDGGASSSTCAGARTCLRPAASARSS